MSCGVGVGGGGGGPRRKVHTSWGQGGPQQEQSWIGITEKQPTLGNPSSVTGRASPSSVGLRCLVSVKGLTTPPLPCED